LDANDPDWRKSDGDACGGCVCGDKHERPFALESQLVEHLHPTQFERSDILLVQVSSLKPPKLLPLLVLLLLLAVTVVVAFDPIAHAQSPLVNVLVFHSSVTPNDLILIHANVTSAIEIKNVTVFYRIGPGELQLSSKSDYNSTLMIHVIQQAEWGLWEY
jgi:hypothetical protein